MVRSIRRGIRRCWIINGDRNTGASAGIKILEESLAGAVGGAFNAITSGKNILSAALTGTFFQAGFAGINYVSDNFINSQSSNYRPAGGSYNDYGVATHGTELIAEVVMTVKVIRESFLLLL